MPAVQTEFDFTGGHREPPSSPSSVVDGPPAPAPRRGLLRPAPSRAHFTRSSLEAALRARLGEHVSLVITDNERTMISTRRVPGQRQVRLHHMFLAADAATLSALGRYLDRSDPGAGEVLGRFIDDNRGRIRRRGPRRIRIQSTGSHHDLQAIYERLNAAYFDGGVDARITWSRRGAAAGMRRRSIKLGSYSSRDALIRVHPALDAEWVPDFFVAYIIYHEMLHQVVPPEVSGSRRQLHGRAFCRAERRFAHYDRAIAWEKENLRRLLRN